MSRWWREHQATAATVLLVSLPWLLVARSGAEEDAAPTEDPTAQHWETRFEREFSAPYVPQDSHDVLIRSASLETPPRVTAESSELLRRRAAREPKALAAAGGSEKTEAAVVAALEWLVRHQEPDGSWDPGRLTKQRVGVTGLAIQAFLARGHHHADPEYGEVVRRGLRYLISCQDRDGKFHPGPVPQAMREPEPEPEPPTLPGGIKPIRPIKPIDVPDFGPKDRTIYNQIIAVETLAEASRLMADEPTLTLRKSLDRGVLELVEHQNPYMGWRYGRRDGDNDTCVTSWALVALAAAKDAGALLPWGVERGGLAWIEKMTSRDNDGRIGYQTRGAKDEELIKPHPRARDPSEDAFFEPHPLTSGVRGWEWLPTNTAIATAAMQRVEASFGRGEPRTDSIKLLLAHPAKWDEVADLFYCYWGTRALRPQGGKEWERWRKGLIDTLLETQVTKPGKNEGGWYMGCVWDLAGPVYFTSMATLCLEECYREPAKERAKPGRRGRNRRR